AWHGRVIASREFVLRPVPFEVRVGLRVLGEHGRKRDLLRQPAGPLSEAVHELLENLLLSLCPSHGRELAGPIAGDEGVHQTRPILVRSETGIAGVRDEVWPVDRNALAVQAECLRSPPRPVVAEPDL